MTKLLFNETFYNTNIMINLDFTVQNKILHPSKSDRCFIAISIIESLPLKPDHSNTLPDLHF